MSTDKQPSALVKFGPLIGPALGAVLMLGLIGLGMSSGNVKDEHNKLNQKNSKVISRLEMTEAAKVFDQRTPLYDVKYMEKSADRDVWAGPVNGQAAYNLPMDYVVRTKGADVDEFTKYDVDGNGFWSKEEWGDSPHGDGGSDFEDWDTEDGGDGQISKSEYENPPLDPADVFNEKDKNDDGVLDKDEFDQWKEADQDQSGDVDLEEYKAWKAGHRVAFKMIGLVTDVTARIDANKMKVIVSWTEPDISEGFLPDDLQYIIYASSPEDRAKLQAEFGRLTAEFVKKEKVWDKEYKKWLKEPSEADPEKSNQRQHGLKAKRVYEKKIWDEGYKVWLKQPSENDSNQTNQEQHGEKAEEEYKKVSPKRTPPQEPSEWNEVTRVSGSSAEIPFLLGATYRYAISSITSSGLLKANRKEFIIETHKDGVQETASVEQITAPVRMENRVAIQYNSGSGEGGSVELGTWVANGAGDYYWITVIDQVDPDEPDLGDLYSLAALKSMKAKANNGDVELDVAFEGLDGKSRFNFLPYGNIPRADEKGEKFQFVTSPTYGFLLSSRAHGDYRLSKKARGPITHSTGEGDMQVRCLNIGNKKTVFEVSRWVESDGKWYLAVLVVEVGDGNDVGSTVNLSSSVDGLSIYDEKGSAVSKGPNVEVDLTAGAFGGIKNRMVSMDDTEFDVFGVLFK